MTPLDELLRAVDARVSRGHDAACGASRAAYNLCECGHWDLVAAAQRVRVWLAEPVLSVRELIEAFYSEPMGPDIARLRAVERAVKAQLT